MPANLHRYYGAGYSHFITTSCYQRRPLLGTPRSRDLFLEVMEQVRQRHHFVVVGYVVMPEHAHLLFSEPKRGNPSLVLAALKQTFAHRLLREVRAKTGAQTNQPWSTPVKNPAQAKLGRGTLGLILRHSHGSLGQPPEVR